MKVGTNNTLHLETELDVMLSVKST